MIMCKPAIICTIGPKTLNKVDLRHLADAGMMMVRLNGVHADINWHTEAIKLLRKTLPDMPILFDLPTYRDARWRTKAGMKVENKGEFIGPQDRRRVELAQQCEYVAGSYIERANEMDVLRERVRGPKLVAKIETRKGVDNIASIASACSLLMLDRRDLAVDVGIESVANAQRTFLSHKFTIVASEILFSMRYCSAPSIPDIIGVSELVMAGADYLLLSEETAMGDHPVETVRILSNLIGAIR